MLAYSDFLFRVVLALGLGASIGVERQWRQRLTWLRTITLVLLGSTLFIALALRFAPPQDPSPFRVVAQIISSIGFLGAGVIMKEDLHVRVLNTAATLWCLATVGSLCGMGYGAEALTSAAAVVLVHLVLRPVDNQMGGRLVPAASVSRTHYLLKVSCRPEAEVHLRVLLLHNLPQNVLQPNALQSVDADDQRSVSITADITSTGRQDQVVKKIVSLLSLEQLVTMVSWKVLAQSTD